MQMSGGNHIALVVSPLRSLMRDQARRWQAVRPRVILPLEEMLPDDIEGEYYFCK